MNTYEMNEVRDTLYHPQTSGQEHAGWDGGAYVLEAYPYSPRQKEVSQSAGPRIRTPSDLLVGNYARRWRVENAISEAVKFFNLNALSSPILVKVHFDVVMTMIADTLYTMLAQKLRGFESCDASKIHRLFVKGKGRITLRGNKITVIFPRRAHNPILRSVPWHRLPQALSWLDGVALDLRFN